MTMSERTLACIQREVNEWGDETFPDATTASCSRHLVEEAKELRWLAINQAVNVFPFDADAIGEEIADVMMLAMQVAGRLGLQVDELIEAKMQKNRTRSWEFDP